MNLESLDREALIQAVADEVYKRLRQNQTAEAIPPVKPKAVLLSGGRFPNWRRC
ncbi:hypothetical protein P7H16_09270 [Paenibacillus larvae]|nr:hypothetical protein [Paenibacillus larvae]MDT2247091.1 hypothetical protein [Paenibacillus larvae]